MVWKWKRTVGNTHQLLLYNRQTSHERTRWMPWLQIIPMSWCSCWHVRCHLWRMHCCQNHDGRSICIHCLESKQLYPMSRIWCDLKSQQAKLQIFIQHVYHEPKLFLRIIVQFLELWRQFAIKVRWPSNRVEPLATAIHSVNPIYAYLMLSLSPKYFNWHRLWTISCSIPLFPAAFFSSVSVFFTIH